MPKIANIGLSSLESIAVRSMLENREGVEIQIFSRFEDFLKLADRFDIYIAASEVILSNLDFFLPRKVKTLAVGALDRGQNSVFPIIYRRTDEAEILAIIDELLSTETTSEIRGDLSQRETEVLRELVSGKTHKEIADSLCISVNTVITHRKNISAKLGIRSVSGLSLYALMNGLA